MSDMLALKGYKELILEHYDQIDLFSHYLGIEYYDIEYCLTTKGYIRNPLRVDINPSLTFKYKNDKIRMIDAARREFNGDIFDIVGLLLGLNSNNPQHFVLICIHIIKNVKIVEKFTDKLYNLTNKIKIEKYKTIHKEVEFKHSVRNWNYYDEQYWNNMFIELSFLNNEYVKPVNTLLINDFLYYSYISNNEGYVYNYGLINNKYRVKFYFPFEIKNRKFRTNVNISFENPFDFKSNEILFIIKSTKDRLVIKNLLSITDDDCLKHIFNTSTLVSFNSESTKLSEEVINKLKLIYKYIVIYLDQDKVGNKAKMYYKEYGIKVIFINSKEHKDISDYAANNKLNKTINFLKSKLCSQLETLKI